ncbi:Serine/threonine-protein kinase BRI1-like 1 [Apostasia shenzhenica]|uniref:Serine/threonine-protein kinase BRI1-like 1 n=1 Tax=Apostasia shenzhenica TaxID=1088818 RepID=A0A2I0AEU5_9ASPA|nr:Serine/threonine-protein kinase BRI1-like 1 [Apostasia shenzhenica]
MENGRGLVELCIEAAASSSESVEKWRRQRRTLERLPSQLADAVLRRLRRARLLFPSLLEVFQHSVEEVDLNGENSVDAEWMTYLGAFRYLRSLLIADCKNISSASLWPLSGLSSLKELDLSRCSKITDAGIKHLLSISNLEKLWVSETGLTSDGVMLLSALANLRVLDLGGIPVTDKALYSLQVLTNLEYLDIWGSDISNIGASTLENFSRLSCLNVAWTKVTRLPNVSSLTCLNMSNCTIYPLSGEGRSSALLSKLTVTGATFADVDNAFSNIQSGLITFLDMSYTNIERFNFMLNMKCLQHLDLRYSKITDGLMEQVASVGESLRYLNLNSTRITLQALHKLVGRVPNLETLALSHTVIDDSSLAYISMMPSVKVLDLSHTRIRGFIEPGRGNVHRAFSLGALQNLTDLKSLNLEDTQLKDEALQSLSVLNKLECLYLKSDFLTDISLYPISFLQKLRFLGVRNAVLTENGLLSYMPPPQLRVFDLRGCWLLSVKAISSFGKKHPQIELRHEHALIPFVDQNACSAPFSSLRSTKTSISRPKTVRSTQASITDERIQYSREELLQLESSPRSSYTMKDVDLLPDILRKNDLSI